MIDNIKSHVLKSAISVDTNTVFFSIHARDNGSDKEEKKYIEKGDENWHRCSVRVDAWTMTWAESFRGLRRGGMKKPPREDATTSGECKDLSRSSLYLSSLSCLMRLHRNVYMGC